MTCGFCLIVRFSRIDEATLHLPGREVLDVADFDPALRAEHLHAPRLGGGDDGAEIAGRAAA